MPKVVEIQTAEDPRDVIHQAVQLLAEGELVAVPTETAYVLAAHSLQPAAVKRLAELSGNHCQAILAIKGHAEALDFLPELGSAGLKLSRRCWPGPVTLVVDISQSHGLTEALSSETRNVVCGQGELRLRVPAHDVVLHILRLMPAPLVLSDEMGPGKRLAVTVDEIIADFGESPSLMIDDGPCRYGQASTEVQVDGVHWKVTRPGVVTERTLGRLASEVYLFVCTGNTCRSPMAESLFRKLLAEKLGCSEELLVDQGYVVASAGLAAALGSPPSPEAVEILDKWSVDLRSHESQPLTPRLLQQADYIFTMTRNHRDAILWEYPQIADRVQLLSRNGTDISDPIGGTVEQYSRCADEIEQNVRALLAELDPRTSEKA